MRAVLFPALLLAACSQPATVGNGEVADINGAADRAESDINSYDTNTATNVAAEPPLEPAAPGEPGGLPDDKTPISEAPIVAGTAQDAANVVQLYYASIEGGKYAAARALWEDGASKLSPVAFAASFARYKEYHANIGAPGDVEGAAGSRYVSVPVQVYARLRDGRPDYQSGNVTLRRVGEVDGATADQKKWHIYAIELKPAPGKGGQSAADAASPPVAAARYRCMDGSRIAVRFDNVRDTASIVRDGKPLAVLDGQKPASGIWYRKGPYELRGKGDAATLTTPGQPPIACTVIR